jgi:hypothetical protein
MSLLAYFAQFGPVVDARIVMDRMTGRSKGYGFVTYADPASASAVVAAGYHQIEGRQCNVNVASERAGGEKRPADWADAGLPPKRARYDPPAPAPAPSPMPYQAASPYSPYGLPGSAMPGMMAAYNPYGNPYGAAPGAPTAVVGRLGDNKLFIASLPLALTEQRLAELLAIFGDVTEAKIVMDREKNESKGYGFVRFPCPLLPRISSQIRSRISTPLRPLAPPLAASSLSMGGGAPAISPLPRRGNEEGTIPVTS